MPWNSSDAKKHIQGLTAAQEEAWAKIANTSLASCLADGKDKEYCEGYAIRVANSKAKQTKGGEYPIKTIRFYADIAKFAKEDKDESWIQVFMKGKFVHPDGEFNITDKMLDEVISNFKTIRKNVIVDYMHMTAAEPEGPESGIKAGDVLDLEKRENGLWAKVKWTKRAAEYIQNDEYSKVSPEFSIDYEDEKGKKHGNTLLAIGLTNRPFLKEMEEVTLSEALLIKTKTKEVFDLKEQLIKLLKLDEKTEEKDILKKIESLIESDKKLSEVRKSLKLEDKDDLMEKIKALTEEKKDKETETKETSKENKQLSERLTLVEKENKTLKDKMLNDDAEKAFNLLLSKGKIKPVQKEKYIKLYKKDSVLLSEFTKEAGQVIDFSEHGSGGEGKEDEKDPGKKLVEIAEGIQAKEKIEDYNKAYQLAKDRNPELVKAIEGSYIKDGE